MPLIKKEQTLPKRNVIILIHGEPGLGKTSIFNTCDGLLIDFEDGVGRSHGRKDTILVDRAKGWKDVLDEEAAGTFNGYKTIGIDTPKAMLDDFLMVYVKDQDFALRKNMLKAYGAIGEEAKQFYNRIRGYGADIVNMVHSTTDKDGDRVIKVPDVTGQSLQLLKRFSDQIGYMYSENGNRVIDFRIQDGVVTKDTANLGKLIIPDINHPTYEGWLLREVINKVKERIEKMDEAQLEALTIISEWRSAIDALEPTIGQEDVDSKAILESYSEIVKLEPEALKKQLTAYFQAHLKKIDWFFDKTVGVQKFVPRKQPVQTPTTDSALAAEAYEGSVVNPNPHMAAPKDDLFATKQ